MNVEHAIQTYASQPRPGLHALAQQFGGRIPTPASDQTLGLLAGMLMANNRVRQAAEILGVFNVPKPGHDAAAVIVDPGYEQIAGHHHHNNLYFARLLAAAGLPTRVFGHASLDAGAVGSDLALSPAFAVSPYGALYKNLNLFCRFQGPANDLFYLQFVQTLGQARPEVFVVHSAKYNFIEGFARYLANYHAKRPIKLVMGVVEPHFFSEKPQIRRLIQAAYGAAVRRIYSLEGVRCRWLLESQELADALVTMGADRQDMVIEPYPGGLLTEAAPVPSRTRSGPTAGFLGHSRLERGVMLVPELALRTLGYRDLEWSIQLDRDWMVHQADPTVLSHVDQLDNKPGCRLMAANLPMADYHHLLATIDIMVLPYADRYRNTGSGIAVEGLRMGQTLVVPAGSTMAQMALERGGCVETFDRLDVPALVAAVERAVDGFDPAKIRRTACHDDDGATSEWLRHWIESP